jgi:hypothetical protein
VAVTDDAAAVRGERGHGKSDRRASEAVAPGVAVSRGRPILARRGQGDDVSVPLFCANCWRPQEPEPPLRYALASVIGGRLVPSAGASPSADEVWRRTRSASARVRHGRSPSYRHDHYAGTVHHETGAAMARSRYRAPILSETEILMLCPECLHVTDDHCLGKVNWQLTWTLVCDCGRRQGILRPSST